MDEEILIGNKRLILTKFRSFMYNGDKYTIFIDVKDKDMDGIPAVYMLQNEMGKYSVPKRETLALLNPVCIDILYSIEPFESENYPKIQLLPWGE